MPMWTHCSSVRKEGVLRAGESVIIVGAGAAGLSAAYFLKKKGIDAIVLEAAATYGGRMEATKEFADFTIPLGAEWIHTTEPVFDRMVNDPSVKVNIETTPYDYDVDYAVDVTGGRVDIKKVGLTETDLRITNSSWIDFYEQYIIPSIVDNILYNKVVRSIDYSKDLIEISTDTEVFVANRVIVTVPVTILQAGDIKFIPALPDNKVKAIRKLKMHDGCKGFIAFKERFYPTVIDMGAGDDGPRIYYDGAYGRNSEDNILGFAAIGQMSTPYLERTDPERIEFMLNELDLIFDGEASRNYIKHIFKDWSSDPFAKGAYNSGYNIISDYTSVKSMARPVDDKLFFAGDLYTNGSNWSVVNGAAEAARRAVETLVGTIKPV